MHGTGPYGYSIQGGVLRTIWIAGNQAKEERTASRPKTKTASKRERERGGQCIGPTLDLSFRNFPFLFMFIYKKFSFLL